ncbi:MAG: hypothetical protein ABGZ53_03335 [Fuerstiella sp.]
MPEIKPKAISESPASLVAVWWAAKRIDDRVLNLQAEHDLLNSFALRLVSEPTPEVEP